MENTKRRQLQRIMAQDDWLAVEAALKEFRDIEFATQSVKRDTEFNTLWYAAEHEGGKMYLQRFFNWLEEQAKNTQ